MQWLDLTFIHFEVEAEKLRKLLPLGVELDLHDGKAWIGIVPFRMEDVTKRGWPAPAWLCDFPEINVRTYVTSGGKRGVWFLSLDATNALAVWTARTFFHAPYFVAEVTLTETNAGITYSACRGARQFVATCAPGEPAPGQPGSFAEWATERYCLYSFSPNTGGLFRTEVQHKKWQLQRGRIEIKTNTLSEILLGPMHPEVLFSRQLDVVMWSLEQIN